MIKFIVSGNSMREIKEDAVREALNATNGNRTEAAKLLDISVGTIKNFLRKKSFADLRKGSPHARKKEADH